MKDYFANKKPIRVIPPKLWPLDSSLSVTHLMDTLLNIQDQGRHSDMINSFMSKPIAIAMFVIAEFVIPRYSLHLIVDVDVPEQALPGVRDVLTGPPQVPHLAAERLNVAETPGAELEGDVPLVSNRFKLRRHHCVTTLLGRILSASMMRGRLF